MQRLTTTPLPARFLLFFFDRSAHFSCMMSRTVEIWSPAGGFFADPKNWRRNTVVAAVGIATVAAFIFKKSTSLEERHAMPNHRIPSQRFAPQSFPVAEGKQSSS